jgi:ribosomal protein S18 acetylase RimI-like enzyme
MDTNILYANDIKKQDLSLLVKLIYNNFIELTEEDKLMHTPEKIEENLKADNSVIVVLTDKKSQKMIAFLTANIIELDDRRLVFYISYIYTAESYRNSGLGTELMDLAEKLGRKHKCNGVMLIFDTYKPNLVRFYENRGYMQDINLRRYERHDIFYKII